VDKQNKSEFEQFLKQPDDQINLAEGALMVARMEYPELNIESCLQEIHQLADEIRDTLSENPNAGETLTQINKILFHTKGFEGNSEHYYDPKNSFLNDVLERKLGIPVSLSILYIELGKELDLPLSGISFPGHFLVKLDIDDGAIVLDPYFGGISLSEDDLEDRLQEFYGDKLKKSHFYGLLETCSNKNIITRILRNLRNLYMDEEKFEKALKMADYMVDIDDDQADALKARASIYDKLECSVPAVKDYQRYLKINTHGKDVPYIRERIMNLSEQSRLIC